MMLVAKSGQGSKRRGAGLRGRLAVEPSEEPLEIERHGGGKLLEMGFGKANITSLTSLTSIDSLRHSAFNSSPLVVESLESRGGLALSSGLQRDKERLGWEGKIA
jgi:hypothetical protein